MMWFIENRGLSLTIKAKSVRLFFVRASDEIAEHVVEALSAGRKGHADIRENARHTVVENYDLKSICLPPQLQLLEKALAG